MVEHGDEDGFGAELGQLVELLPEEPTASRSDRIAKYNQLLRIEQELGKDAIYGATIWPNKK